jgi:hypothetical protein
MAKKTKIYLEDEDGDDNDLQGGRAGWKNARKKNWKF